jgi:hypothetical protein
MIQTQLLRLDPPYQIISAGGRVGIQVATLIVVNELDPSDNRRRLFSSNISYHSYPVVNYGLKQGLEEQMKYSNGPLDLEGDWAIRRRMQPEGAVWQGVDVKDVKVLGLAGANNDPVGLEQFIYLIPTVWRTDPSLRLWDKNSTSRIYDLFTGLGNVGLKHQKLTADHLNGKNVFSIRLDLEQNPSSDGFYIKVVIREDANAQPWEIDKNVFFRCVIEPSKPDSISECATTIIEGVQGIRNFLPIWNVDFIGRQSVKQGDKIWADAMKQLLSLIKVNFKG